MASRKRGVILNISSVGAFAAQQLAAPIAPAKRYGGLDQDHGSGTGSSRCPGQWDCAGDIVVEKNQDVVEDLTGAGVDPAYLRRPRWAVVVCLKKSALLPYFWLRTTPALFTEQR